MKRINASRNFFHLFILISALVPFLITSAQSQEAPRPSQARKPVPVDKTIPLAQPVLSARAAGPAGYVPNQFIIKFRSEGDHALLSDAAPMINQGNSTQLRDHLSDKSDSVGHLVQKHGIKKANLLFLKKSGLSVTDMRKELQRVVAENKRKYPERAARAVSEEVPDITNTYVMEVPAGKDLQTIMNEFSDDPHTEYVHPVYKYKVRVFPQTPPNDPIYQQQWGLNNTAQVINTNPTKQGIADADIDAPEAWAVAGNNLGQGIVVAVIDSGVKITHPDLVNNIYNNPLDPAGDIVDTCDRTLNPNIALADDDCDGFVDNFRGWDFANNDNNPTDLMGHGTHAAGIIAAEGNNSIGVIGVAPRAKIMPIKGAPDSNPDSLSETALYNGMLYAVDHGADVINNSWGCADRCPTDPTMEYATRYAYNQGVVVVWAAPEPDNGDDIRYYSPENSNYPIVVGVSNPNDNRASYSGFGVHLDALAPGVSVASTFFDNNYVYWDGTSFAAPHVAGLAALILSNHPTFTVEDVRQVIRVSADDRGPEGFDADYGFGRINARDAMLINTPLKALITSPINHTAVSTQTISITGTASGGANFTGYQLFTRAINSTGAWTPLMPQPSPTRVENSTLAQIDISSLPVGESYIRLVSYSSNQDQYEDIIQVKLDLSFDPSITGTLEIKSVYNSTVVTRVKYVILNMTTAVAGGETLGPDAQMQFSNDNGATWSLPQPYAIQKAYWYLSDGDGTKTVHVRFRKNTTTQWSIGISDSITLDTKPPVIGSASVTPSGTPGILTVSASVSDTSSGVATVGLAARILSILPGSGIYVYYESIGGPMTLQSGTTFTASLDSSKIRLDGVVFRIGATDNAGNVFSGPYYRFDGTTLTAMDTNPPSVPTNLTTRPVSLTEIELSWTPSTDNSVYPVRYELRRDGAYIGLLSPTSTENPVKYLDKNLQPGTGARQYTVLAMDHLGNRSNTVMVLGYTVPPKFSIGDEVFTTQPVNIYDEPEPEDYPPLRTNVVSDIAYIVSGPSFGYGSVWWEVFFDNLSGGVVQGWVKEEFLEKTQVVWTDRVGVTVTGTTITKSAVGTAWGAGAAASTLKISGDRGVMFYANSITTNAMCGLSRSNIDANFTTIEFAIYLNSGSVQVRENGVGMGTFGTYKVGDYFSVERIGSAILYKKNLQTFYMSTKIAPPEPMLVDLAMQQQNASIRDAKFILSRATAPAAVSTLVANVTDRTVQLSWNAPANGGSNIIGYEIQYGTVASAAFGTIVQDDATPGRTITNLTNGTEYQFRVIAKNSTGNSPASNVVRATPSVRINVTWIDAVGVAVNGNSLTKTAAAGWGNAGAASSLSIGGNGALEFTAPQTNANLMIGLSQTNPDLNYLSIEFAIYLQNTGVIQIRESGISLGTFGNYVINDVLTIERSGSIITYKKNGAIFYTSTKVSSGNLFVDTSLHSTGASVTNVQLLGVSPQAPRAINDLSAAVSSSAIQLSWSAPANNGSAITGYEIQYGTVASGGFATIIQDDANPGATVVNLTNGTAYQFRVIARNALGNSPASNVISDTPANEINVIWTSTVGVSVNGNSITKTSATTGWTAGAASSQTIGGNGAVKFAAASTATNLMCGLSKTNPDVNYTSIEFAVYLNSGAIQVRESGVSMGNFGTYLVGDIISVERSGAAISYKKNGSVFYTSTKTSAGNLLVDASMNTNGGTISNAQLIGVAPSAPSAISNLSAVTSASSVQLSWSAAASNGSSITGYEVQYGTVASGGFATIVQDDTTPGITINNLTNGTAYQFRVISRNAIGASPVSNTVTATPSNEVNVIWTSTVGVSVNGNSITKTSTVTGWSAGAASTQMLNGSGAVKFTAASTSTNLMCGLARTNPDVAFNSIEFAIYLNSGTIQVRESGISMGNFGPYLVNDVLSIERSGTTITYKRNGTVLYTSTKTSTGNLLVDASINTNGGTITNAKIAGDLAIQVASPAFLNNTPIPVQYTCDGQDVNPQLNISSIPPGTQSLALIVDDPDAPGGTWTHWVVFNIPSTTTLIAENSIPGTQGLNDFGQNNWGGPCPPSGRHRYFFKIYALNSTLPLSGGATRAQVENAMQSRILSNSELIGLYR